MHNVGNRRRAAEAITASRLLRIRGSPKTSSACLTEGVGAVTEEVASAVVEHKVENALDSVETAVGGAVHKVTDVVEDVASGIADKAGPGVNKAR